MIFHSEKTKYENKFYNNPKLNLVEYFNKNAGR